MDFGHLEGGNHNLILKGNYMYDHHDYLGGGFKYFWNFHPESLGKWSNLMSMFFKRVETWNHQLVINHDAPSSAMILQVAGHFPWEHWGESGTWEVSPDPSPSLHCGNSGATVAGVQRCGFKCWSMEMMDDEWWMMNDGWWMMNDEWWMMNDEWWMTNDEWWMMNDEWWLMINRDDRWWWRG